MSRKTEKKQAVARNEMTKARWTWHEIKRNKASNTCMERRAEALDQDNVKQTSNWALQVRCLGKASLRGKDIEASPEC